MLEPPLVSILLPVYNGEKTLEATLKSLLGQTFGNYELLVGIDGSKDGSKAIAESFEDDRIIIIEHPENLGLANNLNALIAHMHPQSQYFAMAEQDDWYVPERLEWQLQTMQDHPEVGMVSGIAEFRYEGGSVKFPGLLERGEQFKQGKELFNYLYREQLKVVNSCMLVRKETHAENNLRFNNTYGNFNVDWDYVLRFSLVSNIFGLPRLLVIMNRWETNGSVTRDKKSQHLASRKLLKDFRVEFGTLLSRKDYYWALKQHRKIELGHNDKWKLILRALYYTVLYGDFYFINYLFKRIKRYLK